MLKPKKTRRNPPKPKKDFANIGDFEKAYRKWEVESRKENEALNNDENRSQDRRKHLDKVYEKLLKTSKFFEEFEKQETARYFEGMRHATRRD